jgi:RecA-family ATPase
VTQDAILSGSDYLALPSQDETFLIDSLLPSGGSMLIYGDPKIGKSYAALQLACCLTSGTEWLGFQVPRSVPTVYVQLDTPRSLWQRRIRDLAGSGHPVEAVHFADRETLDCQPFNIRDPKHMATLIAGLARLKATSDEGEPYPVEPGVVIIDTLRESCTGADENDATAMQEVIAHLTEAVKPAALILIHHAKKPNPEAGKSLMNDTRGSSYVNGRMDCIARFTQKAMYVTSRNIEEHSVELERDDDGTWLLAKNQDTLAKMDSLLFNDPSEALRLKAKVLAKLINKSEAACRALLRRRLQFHQRMGHPALAA